MFNKLRSMWRSIRPDRGATRFTGSVVNDPTHFNPQPNSGVINIAPQRIVLNRRQRRAILANNRPRVPKIIRQCRTANGWSCGRG